MKYIEKYDDFININEALENVDTSNFDKVLIRNKSKILDSLHKNNYKNTLKLLNLIFKNKIVQSEQMLAKDIDNSINKIQSQIEKINNKILKYPKIKIYLKDEIKEQNNFIRYIKNKNRKYIQLIFTNYNEYFQVKEKGLIGKFFDWIKKNIWPEKTFDEYNLHYNEYEQEKNKEKVKSYDFGLVSAVYNVFENNITFVFRENFINKINEDNFDKFANLLKITYKHELTHLKDYLRLAQETVFDNYGLVPYLEQNTEILAYAETIIEELRLNKFTDKQIEDIIIEPQKNEVKVKASDSLWVYYNQYFQKNRYMYYRIVSECLDIINKEYR